MSKLSEFQIYAMIRSMKQTVRMKAAQGDVTATRRAQHRLDSYRKELKERLDARLLSQPGAALTVLESIDGQTA